MKTDAQWKKIGLRPHHGICVPLSALRSKKSCGIGEFLDLIPLIDWCKEIKFDCIQLLPLNDSGDDPSPYNALSSCALDPIYLRLPGVDPAEFSALNQLPRIARAEVKEKKLEWLRRLFEKTFDSLSQTDGYRSFLHQNPWLESYALFKALKEIFDDKSWRSWPPNPKTPPRALVDFHLFLQYHCFTQLESVRAYATQSGVFLKGDIPILLSPDSADVWANPSLFQLDLAAGAPPDYYNPLGQRWGFPLFDWDALRRTHFAWWKQRLAVAERLFHLYRIDHVVGFFRIWAIPEGKIPIEGYFVPANPALWPAQGREILEMMIDACSLLPVAEDLGTIPHEVYPILRELGICGTKVIRWQRNHDAARSYIPFSDYEPFSMTTVSTPDCDTLSLWWKNFPDEAIPFAHFKNWTYNPTLSKEQLLSILQDAHHTPSFFHINLLQEYLALFPELVAENPEDERINRPGTLLPTNWTYRLRPYLEDLTNHPGLRQAFSKILRL